MVTILIAGSRGYPAKYGGFETLAQKLAEHWSDERLETIVTGFGEGHFKRPRVTSFKEGLITSVTVSLPIWSRLKNLVSTFVTVLYSVKKFEIDYALVLNDVNLPSAILLKVSGIKTIVHLDGDEASRRGLPKLGKLMHRAFRRLIYSFFDLIVLDSNALLEFAPKRKRDLVNIVKYGVDPQDIYEGEIPISRLLPKNGYVLSIARFVPENNIAEIINAYLKSHCEIPLAIIGRGTGGARYEREISQLCQSSDEKIYILDAMYDSKLIHYLIRNSALYVHGHEAGGTNPILISARCFASRLISHDNVYNREGARSDEQFWKDTDDLVRVFNRKEIIIEESDRGFTPDVRLDDWKSIAKQYLELMQKSG
jgi:glycosyltransferase involved in cell wall biosynthesis